MAVGARDYFGGGQFVAGAADFVIAPALARGWVLSPTAAGLYAVLPDARTVRPGASVSLLNEGAYPLGLKDGDGTILLPATGLGSLGTGFSARVVLVDASTAAGTWRPRIGPIGAATVSAPARNFWVCGGTGTPRAAVYFDGVAWTSATGPAQDHVEPCFLPLGTPFGGRALLVGNGDAGTTMYPYADELDEAGVWTVAPDVPHAVGRAQGAGVAGVGYLFGGDGLFDAAAYSRPVWSAINGLGLPIARGGAARVGDKVLLVPGTPFGTATPKVYWPAADAYFDVAAPAARIRFGCWGADGRAFVAGGYDAGAGTPQLDAVERFDPVAGTWAAMTPMSLGPRYSFACAGDLGGGIVAGGRDTADTARTEAARFSEDGWAALGPVMPGALSECAGAIL